MFTPKFDWLSCLLHISKYLNKLFIDDRIKGFHIGLYFWVYANSNRHLIVYFTAYLNMSYLYWHKPDCNNSAKSSLSMTLLLYTILLTSVKTFSIGFQLLLWLGIISILMIFASLFFIMFIFYWILSGMT